MGTLDNTQRGKGGNLLNKYNVYTHIEHSPWRAIFMSIKKLWEKRKETKSVIEDFKKKILPMASISYQMPSGQRWLLDHCLNGHEEVV